MIARFVAAGPRLVHGLRALRYSRRRIARLVARGAFAEREILAFRQDGFGMRMGELLNGIRLAEGFGARFVFMWPTTGNDGIRSVEQVFSQEFLAAHHREDVDLTAYREVGTWRAADVRHLHRGGGRGIWSISKRSRSAKQKFVLGTEGVTLPTLPSMHAAFLAVGFVDELADIRDRIERLERFDLVIHVRRGDIVAAGSTVALDATYAHKAIPLPLLDVLVAQALAEGQRCLIIGNGVGPLALRDRYPEALFAVDAADVDVDRPELVDFRDFCLIAHADAVVSAGSAFAMVPTLVGGGRRMSVSDLIPWEEQVAAIQRFLRPDPAPHHASEAMIACAHILRSLNRMGDDAGAAGLREEVLRAACSADPDNPAFVLTLVAHLLEQGRDSDAEAALEELMPGGPARTLLALSGPGRADARPALLRLGGALLREQQWDVLERGCEASPWLAFVIGMRSRAAGDAARARALLELAARGTSDPSVEAARNTAGADGVLPATELTDD